MLKLMVQRVLVLCGAVAMLICAYFTFLGVYLHGFRAESSPPLTNSDACSADCNSPSVWRTASTERHNYLSTTWGSYSPGIYFGMKTAVPGSALSTGILWSTDILKNTNQPRHETSQDELERFEWLIHDGRKFGVEHIVDKKFGLELRASFALTPSSPEATTSRVGGAGPSWIQLFDLSPTSEGRKSWLYYFGVECSDAAVAQSCLASSGISHMQIAALSRGFGIAGFSKLSGWFALVFTAESVAAAAEEEVESDLTLSFRGVPSQHSSAGVSRAKKEVEMLRQGAQRRQRQQAEPWFDSFGDLSNQFEEGASFVLLQAAFGNATRASVALFEHLSGVSSAEDVIARIERADEQSLSALLAADFSAWSTQYSEEFAARFQSLMPAGVAEADLLVAQRALTSVLGGIGFFHGSPRIGAAMGVEVSESHTQTRPSSTFSLLTASPSRTVFPRGFLWDEGFHQLLVSEWDPAITMQVLSDWLHAMHFPEGEEGCAATECVGGWIPREMILGDDAQRRVPDEFVTQRMNIANPPTFLLVIQKLLRRAEGCAAGAGDTCQWAEGEQSKEVMRFLQKVYPLLQQWVNWFLVSQAGPERFPGSFRWRGRYLNDHKVLPNTLASGLDDYPRSAVPSVEEHHVDLLCWMITATQVMAELEAALALSAHPLNEALVAKGAYAERHAQLLSRLDALHWSEEYHGYHDVGLNGNDANSTFVLEVYFRCSNPQDNSGIDVPVSVDIVRSGSTSFCPASHPQPLFPLGDGSGGYKLRERYEMNALPGDLRLQHIPRVGYVSIFPLLLKLVDARSLQFAALLDVIENPDGLWTEHGLRSIARTDKFYLKKNSAGDDPYWRGPIWMNINYLALAALHHYGGLDAAANPLGDRTRALYVKLRENVQRTIVSQYQQTGFFWEQYDDSTGRGIKGHPFTGWTALVVNIIAEKY